MNTPQRDFVPSFQLYGEPESASLPDLIHFETLKDRSQLHDWQIKPHRHYGLCQIMRFETPNVRIDLDGRSIRTTTATILFLPPKVVHGFRFMPDVIGTVTTIPAELLRTQSPGTEPVLLERGSGGFDRLVWLLNEMAKEFRSHHPHRDRVIHALAELAYNWVERARLGAAAALSMDVNEQNSDKRLTRFTELVEENFTRNWSTADYADAIGISKAQLTRDCRAVMGSSPLQVIHARIVKEANRKLAYTPWPISQISEALGFSDMGYFSRFYRNRTGETPSQYRARIKALMMKRG